VAAATEGFLLGIPAIAVSLALDGRENYPTAGRVAAELVLRFKERPFSAPLLLNVNVPDIEYAQLRGVQVTRLGRRHKAEPVVTAKSPRGETVYWIGPAGSAQDAGEGTDFHAVANQHVSVTPLQVDLTRFTQLEAVTEWLR
jgi:5'-nucleotidase